ncbi:hypothetical protein [Polynucleobacter sp.]|uniref:hypothetical protein n=1 Tax=Polynucleobacter sp. TaxID=2029855 RepID=UPI003F69C707
MTKKTEYDLCREYFGLSEIYPLDEHDLKTFRGSFFFNFYVLQYHLSQAIEPFLDLCVRWLVWIAKRLNL